MAEAKSVDLEYVGPHGEVDVPMPLGGWERVAWGDVLTTSEDHANGLLEQPANWKRSGKTAAKKEA
jgi:hypothetical protein